MTPCANPMDMCIRVSANKRTRNIHGHERGSTSKRTRHI